MIDNGNFYQKEHFNSIKGLDYLLYLLEAYVPNCRIYNKGGKLLCVTFNTKDINYMLSGGVDKLAFGRHGENSNYYPTEYKMKKSMILETIEYLKEKKLMKKGLKKENEQ